MCRTVVVGMSGGVDSSVAAYLLKRQGYDVIGVTMQIWHGENDDSSCCGLSAVNDARRVADMLDIPFYVMNFRQVFKERVIDYFVSEYEQGRTPNPCIACNTFVKWESLLQRAQAIGADYMATGHYAQVVQYPETGRWTLKQAAVPNKDQTYALYGLTQQQLCRTLMPAGGYSKQEIRGIAQELGLQVADKPDSQEICFVPDNDYAAFISNYSGKLYPPGRFVDMDGNDMGAHKGIINYTVGQRKGFGIGFGRRVYVKALDTRQNRVILADSTCLYERALLADNINFMAIECLHEPMDAMAKVRYNGEARPCSIYMENELLKCVFHEPVFAVTPGQAVVIYDVSGKHVLCGGVIISACSV